MKFLIILFLFFSLTHANITKEIRVAVAANVGYAIDTLVDAFHTQYPDIAVDIVMGSSGKLTAQMMHGAPYDLFLSANMMYPEKLYAQGIAKTKAIIYAQGALALFTTKNYNLSKGLLSLAQNDISSIAIANPHTAPYGVAAKEALQSIHYYDRLKSKFVYGESISQTVTYAKHVADIGIIAKSSLFSPHMLTYKKGIHWVEIPSKYYTPIAQGMVMLHPTQEAQAFYDFMLSQKAKEVLKSFGYSVP